MFLRFAKVSHVPAARVPHILVVKDTWHIIGDWRTDLLGQPWELPAGSKKTGQDGQFYKKGFFYKKRARNHFRLMLFDYQFKQSSGASLYVWPQIFRGIAASWPCRMSSAELCDSSSMLPPTQRTSASISSMARGQPAVAVRGGGMLRMSATPGLSGFPHYLMKGVSLRGNGYRAQSVRMWTVSLRFVFYCETEYHIVGFFF